MSVKRSIACSIWPVLRSFIPDLDIEGHNFPTFCSSVTSLLSPGKQVPPIANAGRDVVVQPGALVVLNGIESLPLGGAHITDYHWTLQSGSNKVSMEVWWAGLTFVAVVQGDM